MKKVIYAGSFDPIHMGHVSIVNIISELFDKVYVVIATNTGKTEFIPHQDKIKLISKIFKDNLKVEVIHLENIFVADYAKDNDIKFMVRGIRNVADFEIEKKMSHINTSIYSELKILYISVPKEYEEVSSSDVRSFVQIPNWENKVRDILPKDVYKYLIPKYRGYKHEFLKTILFCSKSLGFTPLMSKVYGIYNTVLYPLYTDDKRFFHNLMHIIYGLDFIDGNVRKHFIEEQSSLSVGELIDELVDEHIVEEISDFDIEKVKLAYWFHDAYYIVSKEHINNELESTKICDRCLTELGFPKYFIDEICNLIMITDTKERAAYTLNEALICDVDLIGIGKNTFEKYMIYINRIRKEHIIYSDKEWVKGRKSFLKHMLSRKTIYKTKYYRTKYETYAIYNMKRELSNLEENYPEEI